MPCLDLTPISDVLAWAAPGILAFYCAGCRKHHIVEVEKPNRWGAVWQWDQNAEKPTLSPSINILGRCHMFVRAGQLEYLPDCKHDHAGRVVDMVSVTADHTEDTP